MVVRSLVAHTQHRQYDEVVKCDSVIERLKKMRALNSTPEQIGLTEYTWRSFAIGKHAHR